MESLAIQRQIRENASYLQDYFTDLHTWEKSMTKKEQQLQNSKKSTAPVRKTVSMNVRGSQGSVSIQHPLHTIQKEPAAHTYDKGYKKWEEFDEESALREIDQRHEIKKDRIESIYHTTTRKKVIEMKPAPSIPSQPNIPHDIFEKENGNNYFKAGEYANAIKCYSRSLSYNPRNPIVLSNRAMAHLKIHQYEKAEIDSTVAINLDAQHVKSFVRRATARNALGKHHAALGDLETAQELEPTNKTIANQLKTTREQVKQSIKRTPTTFIQVHSKEIIQPTPQAMKSIVAIPTPPPVPMVPKIQVKLPEKSPSTAYEFLRVWKSLKHSVKMEDLRHEYLRRLRLSTLPKLFRDSIESDLLSELLTTLFSKMDQIEFALNFLHALSHVPRFSMVSMFLTNEEKNSIQQAADILPDHPYHDSIKKSYRSS